MKCFEIPLCPLLKYEYALRAVGDVFVPMIILICSCWIFSIGLAYFLSIRCGLGLIGLWIGLAIDESVRAIVTYVRWKNKKYIQKRVILSEINRQKKNKQCGISYGNNLYGKLYDKD